ALSAVLKKHQKVLNSPPYNYMIHTTPVELTSAPYYHWHIEIIPRLTKLAGFEWGTGFYINPTPPEEATIFLQEAEV
ncbi:MAG: galactose-1-phosphate uridylyltransferase, partial [Syntrophorhabdales bacterium]